MELDPVIERFRRIPGARVGYGPRHPQQPDLAAEQELTEFLGEYPGLQADQGYIEFLHKYCGASIENEDVSQIVDILGFTDASTNIYEMDGPVVDNHGYLLFTQCVYHITHDGKLVDTQEHDFAYDMTGERKPGVYWLFSSRTVQDRSFEWHSADFTSWLSWLVDRDGLLAAPADS